MQTTDAPLKYLGPQWFALVMGWGGLALAWKRAGVLDEGALTASIAWSVSIVALLIYLAVFVLSIARVIRHPDGLREDLGHPVRYAFAGAFPVSTILLSAVSESILRWHGFAYGLFITGLGVQVLVSVWVVSAWFRSGLKWPSITPIVLIPVVGNVLVPLAGVPLGFQTISVACLALGLLMWPVVLALLLARTAMTALPERLLPSWFITIAPPAITGPALLTLGAPGLLNDAMAGLATFFALFALTLVPQLRRMTFGMPFWAMSFPSAAFSSIVLSSAVHLQMLRPAALVLLMAVTTLMLWLSAQTVRGLMAGRLLVAEPVAQPVVVRD